MPRVRHILGLLALVLLVAYFGVWRGYQAAALAFGPAWGSAAGMLSLAGLAVIATVGVVVVRTLRALESGAGPEAKRAKNQPD
jgi:hypothetical protein